MVTSHLPVTLGGHSPTSGVLPWRYKLESATILSFVGRRVEDQLQAVGENIKPVSVSGEEMDGIDMYLIHLFPRH